MGIFRKSVVYILVFVLISSSLAPIASAQTTADISVPSSEVQIEPSSPPLAPIAPASDDALLGDTTSQPDAQTPESVIPSSASSTEAGTDSKKSENAKEAKEEKGKPKPEEPDTVTAAASIPATLSARFQIPT